MKKSIIEQLSKIEEQVMISIDLLEIAESYCESITNKASGNAALGTLLRIIISKQKNLIDILDEFV